MPELAHIDLARVGFSVSQTRNRSKYGIYASLTPLRFHGGAEVTRRRGRDVRVQRVIDSNGREMLYIYTLYLPRFMDQSFSEKLVTIFHELWHISPQCNGDIRRHHGRCYAHTGSQANYDRHMKSLTDQWLSAHQPSDEIIGFLKQNFVELHAAHGGVYGSRYARPKLIPVALLPPAPSANTP
jgi:predicted metallopeptidase